MNTTTSAAPEPTYFDWESRVAAPVLGIGEIGIPVFGDTIVRHICDGLSRDPSAQQGLSKNVGAFVYACT